jgi:acetate kinase
MEVLVVNAGSSSLKYQLINMETEETTAKGLIERIGIEGSKLTQTAHEKKLVFEAPMNDHIDASKYMIKALTDGTVGVVKSMGEISAVGHRVVQGGERFSASVLINEDVLHEIEANIPLAPLHNPANLMGIKACQQVMPDTQMVAVFDTAFHQTMPPKAYLYGLPMDYYRRLAATFLGLKREDLRIITCHLGNGSSIAAVDHGKCVDTSMGMTPLEGLVMGTRSGNLDPAVLQYIMNSDQIDVDTLLNVLNKESGLLGISGVSSDMRDIEIAAAEGNQNAQMALDMLYAGIKKYIGAYAAIMGGVDVIVFTAGIGENGMELRENVMDGFGFLGAVIDKEKNKVRGKERDISAQDSRVKVLVIPTNEEIVIARDTLELVGHKG